MEHAFLPVPTKSETVELLDQKQRPSDILKASSITLAPGQSYDLNNTQCGDHRQKQQSQRLSLI